MDQAVEFANPKALALLRSPGWMGSRKALGAVPGASGRALWAVQGSMDDIWGSTGGSWRRPGAVLEVLEASSCGPGGPWKLRGPALGGPGGVSGRLWRVLEAVQGEDVNLRWVDWVVVMDLQFIRIFLQCGK